MSLEFTHVGRRLILHNMFGRNAFSLTTNNAAYQPILAGRAVNTAGTNVQQGSDLCIHFYGGTRPDITTMPIDWQGTAYAGSTKLYPIGTSFSTIDGFLPKSAFGEIGQSANDIFPTSKLTIDWTNNKVTTPTTGNIASNIFMDAGTITWYAIYAGLASPNSQTTSEWKLAWTGSVGVTGSGADIEFSRVDIPSSSYPINFEKMSFSFPQSLGGDVTFSKNIFTTALANIIGAGHCTNGTATNGTQYINFMSPTASANTRYVNGGSTANMIQFYNGTRPASPDEAVPAGNTLIGSVNIIQMIYSNMTQVNTAAEVSLASTGTWLGSAVAVGNPNWCRIMSATSSGYAAIDCTAGLPGSGAVVIYQDPITTIGQSINVTSVKFVLN